MGRRGPAPKPTRLKILSGSRKPRNTREPMPPRGRPRCPEWLDAAAKRKWKSLVPILDRVGILTVVDGDALTVFCQAMSELQWASETIRKEGRTIKLASGFMQPHPAVAMQRSAWAAVKTFGALLGLNPSARTALSVDMPHDDEDPAEAFLRGKSG